MSCIYWNEVLRLRALLGRPHHDDADGVPVLLTTSLDTDGRS